VDFLNEERMERVRSLRGIRTALALAVVAAVGPFSQRVYGAGVQVSLASSFNANDILRYSGGWATPTISWDNSTPGGSVDNWLMTQSAASQLASSQGLNSPAPVGINDNGLYTASGARLYDVQLGFTNATPAGTNVVVRANTPGNFTFSVPANYYSQFAIFGSSGSGSTTLTITLTYGGGSPTVLSNVTLPDWYSGNPGGSAAGAAGTVFALTPAMSRQAAYSFPSGGYQVPNVSGAGAYIFGVNLAPDSTRQLTSVQVAYAWPGEGSSYTVANFLAAAGALASPPVTPTPAPGTWILLLTGLLTAGGFLLRKRWARTFQAGSR